MPARVTPVESRTLQQPQVERREHQHDADVHHQPLPEPVPEEHEVHTDHDRHHRQYVKRNGSPASHPSLLLRADLHVNLTGPVRRNGIPSAPALLACFGYLWHIAYRLHRTSDTPGLAGNMAGRQVPRAGSRIAPESRHERT